MRVRPMPRLHGRQSIDSAFDLRAIYSICSEALTGLLLDERRVSIAVPDHTRHAPSDLYRLKETP
jgi:hypothetical protein